MPRAPFPSRAAASVLVCFAALAAASACLRRDVAAVEPTTKISFETEVAQPAIDKVDLLIMVDNSSSMGDKQRILADAVPDLVRGLVQPKCVDKATRAPTETPADPLKPDGSHCPAGLEPAFAPITDMHIGVLSSSLGGMGGTACNDPKRQEDDRGHLLARGRDGADVPAAGNLHFISWYPDVESNTDKKRHPDPPGPKTTNLEALDDAFGSLVVGVGQNGCGLEAQLESVYRFLVQPDPWTSIRVDNGLANYGPPGDVDLEILKQRAAFLRPDSLVAIVLLSDEDDSIADPLWAGGKGFLFMSDDWTAPRATQACASNPAAPECRSCDGFDTCDPNQAACRALRADPNCNGDGGRYTAEEDNLNVRFHKMKERFGLDPQFPITRYVDAFQKRTVPSRANEHTNGTYVGRGDCTNPLFASSLPSQAGDEFCKLPQGPRTKDLVYFAVIGGVPNALLPEGDATVDWSKLLGRDPYGWTDPAIDPHMIPSTTPRRDLPPPSSADDADPIHGREWTTNGTDLELACAFDLYQREGDKVVPVQRKCDADLKANNLCDCDGERNVPLCATSDKTIQVRGKAYPTRRELMVARELGDHGIVASLCPKQLTEPGRDDYGYRPAVRSIVRRFEDVLTATCVPRPLVRENGDGSAVPCLVLAILPEPGPDSECLHLGLEAVPPEILERYRDKLVRDEGEAARRLPICSVPQIPVPSGATCRDEAEKPAFCYVEDGPGMKCKTALVFTKGAGRLADARFSLQCVQLSE